MYSLTQASPIYPVIPRLREESNALTHLSPPLKPFSTGISSQSPLRHSGPPEPESILSSSVIPDPYTGIHRQVEGPLTLSQVEGSSGVGEGPLVLSPSKYERGVGPT